MATGAVPCDKARELGQTRGGEPHVEVGAGEGRSGPRDQSMGADEI